MAGGVVTLTIRDATGTGRTARFWSDDGTTAGNLTPMSRQERRGYGDSFTFNRLANVTAYGAGAVVGHSATATSAFSMAAAPADGGEVMVTSGSLLISVSAVPAGMSTFALALYNAAPPSAYTDGQTWDVPAGDRSAYLGSIILGTPVDLGSTLFVAADQINRQITAPNGGLLWAYLVTTTGYTPSSGATYAGALHTAEL